MLFALEYAPRGQRILLARSTRNVCTTLLLAHRTTRERYLLNIAFVKPSHTIEGEQLCLLPTIPSLPLIPHTMAKVWDGLPKATLSRYLSLVVSCARRKVVKTSLRVLLASNMRCPRGAYSKAKSKKTTNDFRVQNPETSSRHHGKEIDGHKVNYIVFPWNEKLAKAWRRQIELVSRPKVSAFSSSG